MPEFYQKYLKSQLEPSQYLLLTILINLLQSIKQVKLEETLATALPLPRMGTKLKAGLFSPTLNH